MKAGAATCHSYGFGKPYACKDVTMTAVRRHTFSAGDLPDDIGARLRRLRQAADWSQAELATRSGIARETIARVERGTRSPLADTVLRLLEILLAAQSDVELEEVVPDWPETDGRQVIGHGPRSRARRRQLELSAVYVAAAAGVSVATLSRFERNAGPTPSLLKTSETPHGDLFFVLKSIPLARALGFVGLEDHEAFCDADDWRQWRVTGR